MVITPTYGPHRSKKTKVIAVVAASMLVIMTLGQLFGYEDQPSILGTLLPVDDQPFATVASALVILAQLIALPYLLGMYLSRLMRWLSGFAGFVVSAFWLLTMLTNSHASNAGLFASSIELPGGLIAALWSFILSGCVVWVLFNDSKFRHDTSS